MRNATRTEGHRLHATGFDVAFVDDGCVQVTRHINCTSGDQIKAPWHTAQNWQRAVSEQCFRIDVSDARFSGVIENFRQIRTGTTLLINWGIQFVNDNASDVGVFATTEAATSQFNTFFHLLWGVVTQGHHEDDFSVQRFSDFIVQRLSKLVLTSRNQTFYQNHFSVFAAGVEVGDDLFHQHVLLVARQQRLNVVHVQWLSSRDAGVSTNDAGGLIWSIVTRAWLSDRFENA
ncbi:hypothetical protein D3C75_780850 [compost metagenome]